MNTTLKRLLYPTMAIGILFASCNKSENTSSTKETTEASTDVLAETTFDEVQEMADLAYEMKTTVLKSINDDDNFGDHFGDCATISLDTTVMPRVLTIDFGTENCLCRDGKYRRGQIIVTFNGRYFMPGTVITHGFNDYYVNDNHVEGLKTLTNEGFNEDGFIWFSIVVNGQITLAENGNKITWSANKSRTWIEGMDTPRRHRDDVFLITGSATASNSNGSGFTRLITNPLRRELSCRWFVSGTIEITPVNRPFRVLDFGDGNCDSLATVTVNGETYTIILR
jgi:hypothetical protein